MLFDVVHEVQARVETLVSSRLKQAEGDVDCLKQGMNSLSDDAKERLGKLEQYALRSVLETAGMRYASALKEWTAKTRAMLVYDSKVDPFTDDGLFQAVKGKPNIAIISATTDGDVFGGFYSVAVMGQDKFFRDPNIFAFSFESHGRCATPQRFDVKEENKGRACVRFFKDNGNGWFVTFYGGAGGFFLGNEKSRTFCTNLSDAFEGIEDTTLTGNNREFFTCTRLIAIQLE